MHIIPTSPFTVAPAREQRQQMRFLPRRKPSGLTVMIDWRKTSCCAVWCGHSRSLTLPLSVHFFFLVCFFSSLLYFISHDIGSAPLGWRVSEVGWGGGGEIRKSSNDTMRQSTAAWIHDRQKPQTFATGSELTRCERERQTERERGRDNVLWLPLNIQWSSCNLSMIFTFIFVIMCF